MLADLPGVEERLCYGTPALYAGKKLVARIKEDGGTLVVSVERDEREALMAADPEAFFFTDHYKDYDYVLVRLDRVDPKLLASVLEGAWRRRASAKLRRATPAAASSPARSAPSAPSRRRPPRRRG